MLGWREADLASEVFAHVEELSKPRPEAQQLPVVRVAKRARHSGDATFRPAMQGSPSLGKRSLVNTSFHDRLTVTAHQAQCAWHVVNGG